MDINDQFLDVDFTRCEQYLHGYVPDSLATANTFGNYADVEEIIPESQWQAECERLDDSGMGNEHLVTRIYNQMQEGSCVANACCQAVEAIQALQFGLENVVHLSAISLYKRIGSSPNSGAMVSDGMKELQRRGALPLNNEENQKRFSHTMPNTGFRTPFPTGWETTGSMFRALEVLVHTSVDSLVSGCFKWPTIVGRQGHSICYFRPTYKQGRIVAPYANSWGDWGGAWGSQQSGWGFDSLSQIKMSAGWAFSIRSVVVPAFS